MRISAAHTKTNGPAKVTAAMANVRRIGMAATSRHLWRIIGVGFILPRVGIQFKTTLLLALVAPNPYAARKVPRDFLY